MEQDRQIPRIETGQRVGHRDKLSCRTWLCCALSPVHLVVRPDVEQHNFLLAQA